MARKARFPQTLFVKEEEDGDVTYIVADSDVNGMADIGEKRTIAVYKLERLEDVEGMVKRTARR